jgi:hypothetical protein
MKKLLLVILLFIPLLIIAQTTASIFAVTTEKKILISEPDQQAHSLIFGARTVNSVIINWQNPIEIPDGYIILGKAGSEVDNFPVDGIEYTANSTFGSGSLIGIGNYVLGNVSSGVTLTLVVSGLTSNATTYHYRIMAYNGSGSNIKYRTFDEKGHLWVSSTSPGSGTIGACRDEDGTLSLTSGENIYYSFDDGVSWVLGANIPGAAIHSCDCAEGGTLLDNSGNPVDKIWVYPDHNSGSGKVYVIYTAQLSATVVEIADGGDSEWNSVAYNPLTSNVVLVADDGTNRIGILANGKTPTFVTTHNSTQWASVTATPGASDGTEFLAVAKNPGVSGFPFMKRVSGVWSLKAGPVSKNYHMVRYMPELGVTGVTSADGTGNDFLYSTDFFESYIEVAETGAYGAFNYDPETKRVVAVSRTANQPIKISTDFIEWEDITNPNATSIWFNVLPTEHGFLINASSGGLLTSKTFPSNTGSKKSYPSYYNNWLTELIVEGYTAPSSTIQAKGQEFVATVDEISTNFISSKVLRMWIMAQDGSANTFKIDLVSPTTEANELIEVGSNTFVSGDGWSGNGTNGYLRTQFIPTSWSAATNAGIVWVLSTDQTGTLFEIGSTGTGGSTSRVLVNTHATGNTVGTVALNSGNSASDANASSVSFWALKRDGISSTLYKNGVIFDGTLAAVGTRSDREIYLGAHNSAGTAASFTTRRFKLFIITTSLTDAEVLSIYNAWLIYTN